MTDNEIWERTKKTYAQGVNDKLNSMIKNANFSPNVEQFVKKAVRNINTDADGKLSFTRSITKLTRFKNADGVSVNKGYAEFMVEQYKKSKKPGSSIAVPTKNKWDKGFEQFLRIADKHNDPLLSLSRGTGDTKTGKTKKDV